MNDAAWPERTRASAPARQAGACWLVALLSCAAAADSNTLSREAAQAQLTEINSAIEQLQTDLSDSRQRLREEQSRLKSMDLEIQAVALRLRKVQVDIQASNIGLEQLRSNRAAYLDSLGERREALALQIVAAYRLGLESRLKLLLNQDSPAHVGRMLAYFDYFSEAQADQIQELRTALEALDRMQQEINAALARLQAIELSARDALDMLQEGRAARQALLADISRQIGSDELRLEELTRNQADLELLIRRLTDVLADIPSQLDRYQHPRNRRGSLPMPLQGRILHAFGQARTGGMHWQGWLIEAKNGTDVQAIAYGRVAYADWLRGYGLLMIIDHGDGFMSLYGNNESLLFEPGDWVEAGASIGTVGSNPGTGQGLYFELRSKGEAIDPVSWIKRG